MKVFPPDRIDRGGDPRPVLDGMTLRIPRGEFCALIGPSGTGKTTILNLLAGLDRPDAGTVSVLGRRDRDLIGAAAYMPQRDALLPWRRIMDNVALPLRLRGISTQQARRQALDLLEQVGLGAYAGAWPAALSGGMRQRVAFLRTLAASGEALLLDEPFGALDALTRAELQDWLDALVRPAIGAQGVLGKATTPLSVLLVTHDVEEALYLADRVVVLGSRPAQLALDLSLPWRGVKRDRRLTLDPSFNEYKRSVFEALGMAMAAAPAGWSGGSVFPVPVPVPVPVPAGKGTVEGRQGIPTSGVPPC